MGISLRIGILDIKYSPNIFVRDPVFGFSHLNKIIQEEIENDFMKYLSEVIKIELKLSIKTQRYARRLWKPLESKYLEFKKAHGLSENIWEATGKLVHSIIYRRLSNGYFIGIDPKAKYPNGISVELIGKCMEFGTKNMPARPLFAPVIRKVKRNIKKHWLDYLHWRFPKRGW